MEQPGAEMHQHYAQRPLCGQYMSVPSAFSWVVPLKNVFLDVFISTHYQVSYGLAHLAMYIQKAFESWLCTQNQFTICVPWKFIFVPSGISASAEKHLHGQNKVRLRFEPQTHVFVCSSRQPVFPNLAVISNGLFLTLAFTRFLLDFQINPWLISPTSDSMVQGDIYAALYAL